MRSSHTRPARWGAGGIIRTLTAAALAVGMAMAVPSAAWAAGGTLLEHEDGTYVWYVDGFYGAISRMPDGRLAYCMELGETSSLSYADSHPLDDSMAARQLAWLMERYQSSHDALTHAAIASLIHEKIDLRPQRWPERYAKVVERNPGMPARMEELRAEMERYAPQGIEVTNEYTEGLRAGRVGVRVRNAAGGAAPGTAFTVTLDGPAEFESGGKTASRTSEDGTLWLPWKATGAQGQVRASAVFEHGTLLRLDSTQDLVIIGGTAKARGEDEVFPARKHFTPAVATEVAARRIGPGEPVEDRVTSGVAGGDWVPGLELTASGYYFTGIQADEIGEPVVPGKGETIGHFLDGLKERGFKPAAHATASFTGPGQSVTARATVGPDGGEAYRARSGDDFGTWVWAFETGRQSEKARDYVVADAISPFLEVAETSVTRRTLRVESTVTEHAAQIGSELSDTITVRGFPADHGEFPGDEALGLGADEPYAQVSVWWAGDPENPANDAAYEPTGAEPPAEDANHRRIGTWDYPAANGTYRVGAGAPDAHGDPVRIAAEDHGWYVFVWSFAGDDRVQPAASRYDDLWEHTRVTIEEPPEETPPEETPPAEPPAEELPLPSTGARVAGAVLACVGLLATGLFALAAAKRRS